MIRNGWITKDSFRERQLQAIENDKKWKKTDTGRECNRRAATRANAKHRETRREYWKSPEVRARIKAKRNSNPEVIARRGQREQQRQEREAHKQSPEYKEVQRQKNKRTYEKLKESGHLRAYYRNRRKNDPEYRIACNCRAVLRSALKRQSAKKASQTFHLIGCSIQALRVHLQAQFKEGMTWENYGPMWEVDHKLPLVRFNLLDPQQQRIAFHFENLQPLWTPENRRKSDKLPDGTSVRSNIIQFQQQSTG